MEQNERRVIVTGGAGFIGSHLVEYLVNSGEKVLVIDDLSRGTKSNLSNVLEQIEICTYSIGRDIGEIERRIIKYEPEVIFNLAACSFVNSVDNPILAAKSNILGTLNVLESMRKCENMPLLVHASSGSVYGESGAPCWEDASKNPTSGYGVSKLASEEYIKVWNQLYEIPFVGLRYYNVYGKRQPHYAVIPIFVKNILEGEPILIHGDGKQTRRFTNVKDVIEATGRVSKNPDCEGEFYNIANAENTSIFYLAQLLMKLLRSRVKIRYLFERSGDIKHLNPITEKAEKDFGFSPKISLEEGLKKMLKGRM